MAFALYDPSTALWICLMIYLLCIYRLVLLYFSHALFFLDNSLRTSLLFDWVRGTLARSDGL